MPFEISIKKIFATDFIEISEVVDFPIMIVFEVECIWDLFFLTPEDIPLVIFSFWVSAVDQHVPHTIEEMGLEDNLWTRMRVWVRMHRVVLALDVFSEIFWHNIIYSIQIDHYSNSTINFFILLKGGIPNAITCSPVIAGFDTSRCSLLRRVDFFLWFFFPNIYSSGIESPFA